MRYLEEMQEALDDLYLEQKKIEAEYRRRKAQTENAVKLAGEVFLCFQEFLQLVGFGKQFVSFAKRLFKFVLFLRRLSGLSEGLFH